MQKFLLLLCHPLYSFLFPITSPFFFLLISNQNDLKFLYSGTQILMFVKKVYRKLKFLVREKYCWKKIKVFLFSILKHFHISIKWI